MNLTSIQSNSQSVAEIPPRDSVPQWVRVTRASAIPPREGRVIRLGDTSIAVFNTGAKFVAVENRCPHKGGPLADGIVGGTTVTCPLHNWRVSLETGDVQRPCDSGAHSVRTYPVRIEDGIILIGFQQHTAAA